MTEGHCERSERAKRMTEGHCFRSNIMVTTGCSDYYSMLVYNGPHRGVTAS